ncbi:MAG: hypothetical protein ACR2RA_10775 [Geminicoccaceae bacterium]
MKTFLSTSSLLLVSFMPFVGNTSEPKLTETDTFTIDLLPGHSVYDEREQMAGVVTAISITPSQENAADLTSLCEELRLAARLEDLTSDGLALEALFIVPYKGMAIEGYYFSTRDAFDDGTLVSGKNAAREVIYDIVSRAGFPPGILDEADVEHEISCEVNQPSWHVRWEDVRPIDDKKPDTVVEHARHRFLAIHQDVIDHNKKGPLSAGLH